MYLQQSGSASAFPPQPITKNPMNSTPPQIAINLTPQQAWELFAVLDSADEREYSRSLELVYKELSQIATAQVLTHEFS
jgi:hypothetical protein